MLSENAYKNKKAYDLKYAKEKLKRVPLDVPKNFYDDIKAVAESCGLPVNTFIKAAIREKMERVSSADVE